jgi:hypothetical protein
MSAGADCAYTLSDKTESMTLDEFITFLEPQIQPPKGAAVCMSSEDYSQIKTAIEQACKKLGTSCVTQLKETFQMTATRVDRLQKKVWQKRHLNDKSSRDKS